MRQQPKRRPELRSVWPRKDCKAHLKAKVDSLKPELDNGDNTHKQENKVKWNGWFARHFDESDVGHHQTCLAAGIMVPRQG